MYIRFRFVDRKLNSTSNLVVISSVISKYSNTYDPTSFDQFVIQRTRARHYKSFADNILKAIVLQIIINTFVELKPMKKSSQKRKNINKHIINEWLSNTFIIDLFVINFVKIKLDISL